MNMCAECCNKIVIHYYYYYVEDRETSGYSGKKDLFIIYRPFLHSLRSLSLTQRNEQKRLNGPLKQRNERKLLDGSF